MTGRHPIVDYLQRLFQVMRVLIAQLWKLLRRHMRHEPLEGPQLLREGLEKAGGTFVKFGQILSLQVDTLPREYCEALMGLLDSVPTASREQVLSVFQSEFRKSPLELYARFDFNAIASASIGQVHKGVMADGTPVAIKVQRPGVHHDFQRDILLLRGCVWFIFLFRIRSLYFMRDPVRELATWTRDEMDYRREAAYCDRLAQNAEGSATERLPRIYWNLTTSRVLTMEFLEGPTVSTYLKYVENGDEEALARLRNDGFVPSVFSNNVISNFLSDAFRFGVFHADLHPANLLILPNNVVGYVDFGIVASLTPEARRKQIQLTLAYATGSPEEIYREFLNICMPTPDADLEGMRRRIAEMAKTWYVEPAVGGRVRFRISVTAAMMDLLTVCRDYGVLIDREMIKYVRSTVIVDGLVSLLSPGFDIAGALRDLVEEYLVEEASRKIFSRAGALSILTDVAIWMKTGPTAMLRSLDLFERREIRLRASTTSAATSVRNATPVRRRALAAGTVWAFSILFLLFSGGPPAWKTAPYFAAVAAVFVTSWTLWVLLLLRRLVTR